MLTMEFRSESWGWVLVWILRGFHQGAGCGYETNVTHGGNASLVFSGLSFEDHPPTADWREVPQLLASFFVITQLLLWVLTQKHRVLTEAFSNPRAFYQCGDSVDLSHLWCTSCTRHLLVARHPVNGIIPREKTVRGAIYLSLTQLFAVITVRRLGIKQMWFPLLLVLSWTGKTIVPCCRSRVRIWSRK